MRTMKMATLRCLPSMHHRRITAEALHLSHRREHPMCLPAY